MAQSEVTINVLSQWQQRLLLPVDHPYCDLGVLLLRQRLLGRVWQQRLRVRRQ
jgi:hypothetical protein